MTYQNGDVSEQKMSEDDGLLDEGTGSEDMSSLPVPSSDCGVTPLFQKLEPTCATCHRTGSTPYFSEPEAFYNLIINNTDWVIPGDPSNSALIALLRGEATGTYAQMPLGTESFADLETGGQTEVSVAEIEAFITDLDGCQRGSLPREPLPPVERKRARQIVNTLYQHLGITKEDVLPFNKSRNYNDSVYPVYNPDDTQPVTNDPHIQPPTQGPGIRWYALGGGSRLYVTKSSDIYAPTFGQTLIQTSQAWCGFAVKKEQNTALFRHVDHASLQEASEQEIHDNIAYLMLRFWGHVASDEDITAMKASVYDAYITPNTPDDSDERIAWTAVCAALIRDPMWLSY